MAILVVISMMMQPRTCSGWIYLVKAKSEWLSTQPIRDYGPNTNAKSAKLKRTTNFRLNRKLQRLRYSVSKQRSIQACSKPS